MTTGAEAGTERSPLNTVGGDALLEGPTVQARDVHGGIHFHPATPCGPGTFPLSERPTTPRQLPPSTAELVGRAEDIAALTELQAGIASTAPQLIIVTGTARAAMSPTLAHQNHRHMRARRLSQPSSPVTFPHTRVSARRGGSPGRCRG